MGCICFLVWAYNIWDLNIVALVQGSVYAHTNTWIKSVYVGPTVIFYCLLENKNSYTTIESRTFSNKLYNIGNLLLL